MPFVLIPISTSYFIVASVGTFYIPHIVLSFLFIGLFFRIRENLAAVKKWTLVTVLLVFAFLLGMCGPRYLLLIQAPLLLSCVWLLLRSSAFRRFSGEPTVRGFRQLGKTDTFFKCGASLLSLICAGVGYLVNTRVLSGMFQFTTQSDIKFYNLGGWGFVDKLSTMAEGFFEAVGYRKNAPLFSFEGVVGILLFVLIAIVVAAVISLVRNRRKLPKNQKLMVCFFVMCFALNTFVFVFTNYEFVPRLYIPVLIFFVPVVAIWLNQAKPKFKQWVVAWLVAGIVVLCGVSTLRERTKTDVVGNEERTGHMEFLRQEDYRFGYATFWNAGVITEFTNGEIEIAHLQENLDELMAFYWLTPAQYYRDGYHTGKSFLLLTREEYEKYAKDMAVLDQLNCAYKDDQFMVFTTGDHRVLRNAIRF